MTCMERRAGDNSSGVKAAKRGPGEQDPMWRVSGVVIESVATWDGSTRNDANPGWGCCCYKGLTTQMTACNILPSTTCFVANRRVGGIVFCLTSFSISDHRPCRRLACADASCRYIRTNEQIAVERTSSPLLLPTQAEPAVPMGLHNVPSSNGKKRPRRGKQGNRLARPLA